MHTPEINKYIYHPNTPLRKAINDLYQKKIDICLVCGDDMILQGIVTLSDIKKAVIRGADPGSPIVDTMNRDFIFAKENDTLETIRQLSMKKNKYGTGDIVKVPIINDKGLIKDLYINNALENGFDHKTVLVTGGAGYVGSILCRKLLDRGYRVVVLDKLIFGIEPIQDLLQNPHFTLIRGNINNIGDLMSGIKEADYVIHLAGIVGDPASALDPIHTMEINHFSTKSLIELSRHYQISRFIFASSCSVYGASSEKLNEESVLNPVSLYARTKISSENDLLQASDDYFHPTILRFGTIYGISPRMRFDLVANIMTANGYFHKKITVNGGSQWRPMIHVDTAAESYIKILEAPKESVKDQIFNVGSDEENFTIENIAKTIQQFIPYAHIDLQDTVKDKRDYCASFDKIKKSLGFTAEKKLANGVLEMVRAMENGQFHDYQSEKYSNYQTLKNGFGTKTYAE